MRQALTAEERLSIIRERGGKRENILDILLTLQEASPDHCIDPETAALVAGELNMSEAKVYEIVTFYAMLSDKPQADYVLEICNSTPCYFTKSTALAALVEEELGIGPGQTTPDGRFAVRYTPCVGACDIGPVIKVGPNVYGNLDKEKVRELLAGLKTAIA